MQTPFDFTVTNNATRAAPKRRDLRAEIKRQESKHSLLSDRGCGFFDEVFGGSVSDLPLDWMDHGPAYPPVHVKVH